MAEPRFASDDDLPRTFRREREARDREAREREREAGPAYGAHAAPAGSGSEFGPTHDYGATPPAAPDPMYAMPAFDGTVKRFDVPFGHLVKFFLKCVFAAIPALILLGALLFGAGTVMKRTFGWSQFEMKVIPSGPSPAPEAVAPAAPAAKAPQKK